jgi:hypothetical protein
MQRDSRDEKNVGYSKYLKKISINQNIIAVWFDLGLTISTTLCSNTSILIILDGDAIMTWKDAWIAIASNEKIGCGRET